MSRWNDLFKGHSYAIQWEKLRETLNKVEFEESVEISTVEEMARLRKVFAYVDGLLESVDPELLPLSGLDKLSSQAAACIENLKAFDSDGSENHLVAANTCADSFIGFIRPYVVADGKIGRAFKRAATGYGSAFSDVARSLQENANRLSEELRAATGELADLREKAGADAAQLGAAVEEWMGDGGDGGKFSIAVDRASQIEEMKNSIESFHESVFDGLDGAESIKVSVESALKSVSASTKAAEKLVSDAQGAVAKIEEFEEKIFGPEGGGEGLSAALDEQKLRLDEFEEDQRKRTKALNDQIEDLIPGATSAGLASAYKEMKDSFDSPVRNASAIFYVSIGVLVIGSLLLCVEKIYWFGIDWIQLGDWQSVLRSFAYKLPFFGPAVWLAYYASKRRSEYQRLQQEYAHKESLAKSYDSYRRQIVELGVEGEPLMAALLENAIAAISHNASKTLDGKHGDKMPLAEAIDIAVQRAMIAKAAA